MIASCKKTQKNQERFKLCKQCKHVSNLKGKNEKSIKISPKHKTWQNQETQKGKHHKVDYSHRYGKKDSNFEVVEEKRTREKGRRNKRKTVRST